MSKTKVKKKISKGRYKDLWFKFEEDGTISIVDLKEDLNSYCYFCDFNDVKPHLHHIIRKIDGGLNNSTNLIPLCPNHHTLIHQKVYTLGYNAFKGWFCLKDNRNGEIKLPTERQMKKKRTCPISSIKDNKNLIIEGDLNHKATIKIKNPYRKQKENGLKRKQKNLRGSVE